MANFLKGQLVNILGFSLLLGDTATDHMSMCMDCVAMKSYLQKQVTGLWGIEELGI